jgi:hypothetical protein
MARGPIDIYSTANPFKATLDGPDKLTVHGGSGIRVGDSYVLRHHVYGLNGFSFENVSSPQLEDVQLYSIPGMGFYMRHSSDVHLKNCGVRWRPGRPMSITADASHFSECSGSVHLDGVHFEGQGDDGLNVHGTFHDVRAVDPATNTFELGSRPAGGISDMNVGGRYEFRNRNTWAIEGVGLCTSTAVAAGKQHATFKFEGGTTPKMISEFALLTDLDLQPSVLAWRNLWVDGLRYHL